MKSDEWWKSFALGVELDISGMFIYNGLKAFDLIETLCHPADIFEILYNFSVGIERLYKITIILLEHHSFIDIDEFEKSLITHNTIDLFNRIKKHQKINLRDMDKEFLSILSKFYKSHRYERFNFSSLQNIDSEKIAFFDFIEKHLNIKSKNNQDRLIQNTEKTRVFIGDIIKKVTRPVFDILRNKASELNIYTDEIRWDSKAIKIFLSDKLDFIDENRCKKELILFLINNNTSGKHINILKSFEQLQLDPDLVTNHIKALLNDRYLQNVIEEIEEAYEEVKEIKDRLDFLELIDNECLTFNPEE